MAKNMTFEERLQRLQEVVDKLSAPDVALEESVSLFREGQTLTRQCREQVEKARNEVRLLTEEGNTLPFIEQTDDAR